MEKVLEVENQKLKEIQNNIKQMSLLEKDPGIRKTQAGVSFASQNARSFRDSSELQIPGDMFISQVTLTSYKNFIIGLDVVYKSRKGIEKQKIGFQPKNQIENQIVQSMKLSSIEHVQNITGYYSTHIDFLKIISSRGQYIYGGIDKLQSHQQKFSIEIRKDEKPQSFYGTVDLINEEVQCNIFDKKFQFYNLFTILYLESNHASELTNEFVLVTIGCELKKKDTIGGLKNNKRYLTRNEKDSINNKSNYNEQNENLQQKSMSTQRQSISHLSQKNSQQLLQNMNQQSQQQENQFIQNNEKQIQQQDQQYLQQQQQNQNSEYEYNNESEFQTLIKNSQLQQQVYKKRSFSDNNNSELFKNQENEIENKISEQDVEKQNKNEVYE
ncbi:Mannose-binding lectin [Pseudocohnilembus persalinus]|uniref:Mannose-binding lectin n=1 Tax=Pseudocohnilembus persalinus TaxID=266149 RepID=A0A0V0QI94_PSEPJ|nr:Mannose-binding lectin [Pseudocohnilembus persalinus]|eukprot:KRX01999.1 Mannose-binding lectin [Pseudocohnilembus persalinus]